MFQYGAWAVQDNLKDVNIKEFRNSIANIKQDSGYVVTHSTGDMPSPFLNEKRKQIQTQAADDVLAVLRKEAERNCLTLNDVASAALLEAVAIEDLVLNDKFNRRAEKLLGLFYHKVEVWEAELRWEFNHLVMEE